MGTFADTPFGNDYALDWVASLNACANESAVERFVLATFDACIAFDARNGGKGIVVPEAGSPEADSLKRKDLDPTGRNADVLAVVRGIFAKSAREPVVDYGAREACAAVAAAAYAAASPDDRRTEPELARLVRGKSARTYVPSSSILGRALAALHCAARNEGRLAESDEWSGLVGDVTTRIERRIASG